MEDQNLKAFNGGPELEAALVAQRAEEAWLTAWWAAWEAPLASSEAAEAWKTEAALKTAARKAAFLAAGTCSEFTGQME